MLYVMRAVWGGFRLVSAFPLEASFSLGLAIKLSNPAKIFPSLIDWTKMIKDALQGGKSSFTHLHSTTTVLIVLISF